MHSSDLLTQREHGDFLSHFRLARWHAVQAMVVFTRKKDEVYQVSRFTVTEAHSVINEYLVR